MNALTLLDVTPISNPEILFVKVTPSGNYTNGTADPLPLNNIANPNQLEYVPLNNPATNPPPVTPGVWNENEVGGYYAQVVRTVTGSGVSQQTSFGLRWYTNGSGELSTGAYPAAITGGELILAIKVPVRVEA